MFFRLLLVLLLLGAIFGGIFGLKHQQFQAMQAQMAQPMPPATVSSTRVRAEGWQPTLNAVGSLVAVSGIDVTAEVAGLVSEIRFQSGGQVEKGEVLVRLDDSVDRATLEGLRADARLAEIQYKRTAELLPRQSVSQADFDIAKATYEAAQARVATQLATIDKKTIRAPFTGLLGIRQVDLGEFVAPGTRFVALNALDPIYVDYALPERFFRQLALGQKVKLTLDAYPDERFAGEVTAIESGVDEGTRTIRVRATLPNPDARLRPGMFAEVQTLHEDEYEVLTVPQTAISFHTYGDFVYVIVPGEEEGQRIAKRRQVITGAVREGVVEIREGLEAGEEVVQAGLIKIRDGQPVQIDNSVELRPGEIAQE